VTSAAVNATAPARVAPVSPLIETLRLVPGVVVVAVLLGGELLGRLSLPTGPAGLAVLIAGGLLVIGAVRLAHWWRLRYWFDSEGDLRLDGGVIVREHRRLALSRLQSVDIAQPLLARIMGLAEVRIEVAGTGDSRVRLAYLTHATATTLRTGVLARAAGLSPHVGEAPETVLHRVPTPRLLAASALAAIPTLLLVGVLAAVLTVTVLGGGAVTLVTVLAVLTPLVGAARRTAGWYDFTVALSPDGLRVRSGLTTRASATVPPGRVHGLAISAPLLWRPRHWQRVTMTVAGQPDGAEAGLDTLIPVAEPTLVRALVERVLPGTDPASLPWQGAPRSVRWRSPLAAVTMAHAVTADAFAVRAGTFTVTTSLVSHARSQSVRTTQGPWERRLGLATVAVDLAPGPVTVRTRVAADRAVPLVEELAECGRRARTAEPPPRWLRTTVER